MLKNLSVYISVYLKNESDYYKLVSLVPDFIDANIINDNPLFKIEGIKNNATNKGKFQTIITEIKGDSKNFLIILDPDDILRENIHWDKLIYIDKIINKYDKSDIIINSYYIKKGSKKDFKFIKSPKFIFNPCTIYNIKKIQNNSNIIEEPLYINYMDDLCLSLIALHESWSTSKIYIPFYKYQYLDGISSMPKKKYKEDINNSMKIYELFPIKITNIHLFYIKLMRIDRLKRLQKKYG